MANIKELASHWKDFPYSYESRDELPDGDEVWVWDTLNLGLPVLWLSTRMAHLRIGSFTRPDMIVRQAEHWCWNCHCQMIQHGEVWVCTGCGDEISEEDIDSLSSPTEEASYSDELDPDPEW